MWLCRWTVIKSTGRKMLTVLSVRFTLRSRQWVTPSVPKLSALRNAATSHIFTNILKVQIKAQKIKKIIKYFKNSQQNSFNPPRAYVCWPSGSEEERIAVETACRFGTKAGTYSSPTAEDVSVRVIMEGEGPKMGGDAELSILLKNVSSEQRRVVLHSQLSVMYYTGVLKATVRQDKTELELLPHKGELSPHTLQTTLLFQKQHPSFYPHLLSLFSQKRCWTGL